LKIEVKTNNIFCTVNKKWVSILKPILKYRSTWFKRNRWGGGQTQESTSYFISSYDGSFLTGFLPRLISFCKQRELELEVNPPINTLTPMQAPSLSGIEFRKFQSDIILKAINQQRGYIQSPTGSGKTIIALGVLSAFSGYKILFLCHSISILKQTMTEMKKFGFIDVGLVAEGKKDLSSKIILASIQSMSRIDEKEYSNLFDIVMVDEVHHISGKATQYYKFLSKCNAIMRIGFTATLPSTEEGKLCIEGLLGPEIGKIEQEKLIDLGYVARPFITLIPVPMTTRILNYKKYTDIYQAGIVHNKARNRIILSIASSRIKENKTVLVLVKEIEHGHLIEKMSKVVFDIDCLFVQGKTETEVREKIRELFNKKIVKLVVCTVVWKEGIDIPSLDCVINAASGKSEIATLQIIGRGSRTTENKTEVEIIDFLDPYKYISQHAIMRLSIYVKEKWL